MKSDKLIKADLERTATAEKDLRIYQEAFLLERCLGIRELSEQKAIQRRDRLGIHLPGPYYCTVIFAPYLMDREADQIDTLLMRIMQRIRKAYRSHLFASCTVSDSYCNVVSVISFSTSEEYRELEETTRSVTASILRSFSIKMFVAVGEQVDRFVDISRSHNSASAALAFKYTFARDNVILACDVKHFYHPDNIVIRQHCDRVLGCFYDGDLPQMSRRLQELREFIASTSSNELDNMRNVCIELTASILRQAYEIGVEYPDSGIYTIITQTENVYELIYNLMDLSRDILSLMQKLKNDKNRQVTTLAKDYIEKRLYDKDLTIQNVSEYVDLSQAYFSSIFFKETGEHLIEYINRRRVEEAMRLLKSTNTKIVKLSQLLGFSSPSYFNNVFKKYSGTTPQSYRSMDTDYSLPDRGGGI